MNRKSTLCLTAVLFAGCVCFVASATAQEKHITKSDLPPAVQKTAEDQSKGATVRGYTTEMEDGKREYEVEMTVKGHSKDVSIDPEGNVLEVEEQVELRSLPAAVRDALRQKAGSGKITKIESITKHDSVVAYEAHVMSGTKKSEVQVGPDGKALDHEE